jgi:RNA polymerase primary sigma factor
VRDKDLHDKAGGLLDVLNNREKKIISQRFGFGGGKRKTLEEVGRKLGVSRERIRQMENIALSKLRRMLSQKDNSIGASGRSLKGKELSWPIHPVYENLLFSEPERLI